MECNSISVCGVCVRVRCGVWKGIIVIIPEPCTLFSLPFSKQEAPFPQRKISASTATLLGDCTRCPTPFSLTLLYILASPKGLLHNGAPIVLDAGTEHDLEHDTRYLEHCGENSHDFQQHGGICPLKQTDRFNPILVDCRIKDG